MKTLKNYREKMSVRVNVRMSKIMRTPKKSRRKYVRGVRQLLNPG